MLLCRGSFQSMLMMSPPMPFGRHLPAPCLPRDRQGAVSGFCLVFTYFGHPVAPGIAQRAAVEQIDYVTFQGRGGIAHRGCQPSQWVIAPRISRMQCHDDSTAMLVASWRLGGGRGRRYDVRQIGSAAGATPRVRHSKANFF